MNEVKVSIEIPEADKLEKLLKRHEKLVEELLENIHKIASARIELECKINRPAPPTPADCMSDVK